MILELSFSDAEIAFLNATAKRNGRTQAEQIQHWLRIGWFIEQHPHRSPTRVDLALAGLVAPMELTPAEQEQYLDEMAAGLWKPSSIEDACFAEMRSMGTNND